MPCPTIRMICRRTLQALAGPAAGPNGGQIYIDGFSGGRLPPKESIREIRINSNPFAAEYDKLGFGRIEIFTKPGTDKFRGQAFFNFGDKVFDSRNPFSTTQAPFQSRQFGGSLSGPLIKKASFFLDFEKRDIDEAASIVGSMLDSSSEYRCRSTLPGDTAAAYYAEPAYRLPAQCEQHAIGTLYLYGPEFR